MAHDTLLAPFAGEIENSRPAGRGFAFATLLARLFAARSPRQSEVERFIKANGGVLTDSLEREISRRFGNMSGM